MSVIQKKSRNQDITASDVLNRRDLLRDAAMVSGTVLMGKHCHTNQPPFDLAYTVRSRPVKQKS